MASSYFASTGLTICAFVFMTLIIILVRSKLKPDTIESKIYIWNVYLTMLLLCLELITSYTISIRESIPKLNDFLCESYVFLSIIWEILFVIYIYFLLREKKEIIKDKKYYLIVSIIVFLGLLIPSLIVGLLEVSYQEGANGIPNVIVGGPINILHIFSFTGAISIIAIFILKRQNIKNFYLTPFLFAMFVFCLAFILQLLLDFQINESVFMFSLIMAILYFTVESQDAKLVEEVNNAKKEAETANKVKTEFLMNISHQIRTPLNTILGFSESLLEKEHLTLEDVKNDTANIKNESYNLLNLINNILDISKIESNKETIENKEYMLNNLIFELNSFVPSKIQKEDLKYLYGVAEDCHKNLIGDYNKIYKILCAILTNAIEYTNFGEVSLTITNKDIDAETCELCFTIKNNGHAMSEEFFNKDYYDFVKLNENSDASFDSTLLGVIIAKSLIAILGGTIEFINQPGKGTQYIIRINQKFVGNDRVGKILEDKVNMTKKFDIQDYKGKKILIVDDSKVNLNVAERLLKKYNFEIDLASSGSEALEKIKSNKYDIIFLDQMMPEMDGIETLNNMKTSGFNIPPVIALTANYDGSKETYIKNGFYDCLSKPIDLIKLNDIVSKIFDKEVGDK